MADESVMNRFIRLLILLALMAFLALIALRFGLRPTGWGDVWSALLQFRAEDADHVVIRDLRLPRMVAAMLSGAALGMAGALMQGLTRNPLADPGLLGVNAGASMGVIAAIWLLGIGDPALLVWVALAGAGIATGVVYLLGDGGSGNTARLILAGAAVSALFLSLGRGVLLVSQQTLDVYRYWVLGGFDGIRFDVIVTLLPFLAVGAIFAAIAAISLNALMLGLDTARSLGVRVGLAQLAIGLAIVLLCGTTVAMAGPIAFVGLLVPHLARRMSGPDMRWLVLYSAPLGAALLVLADLMGRLPLFGGNMQAGVMAALVGGPVLIWLVRRNGVHKL